MNVLSGGRASQDWATSVCDCESWDIVSKSARMYKNSGLSACFRCDCRAKKCYTRSVNGTQSGGKNDMASAELIENLEEIARIKESLPARSRGWSSELGLHVQMREAGGMARLQAGGKFRSRVDLRRDSPTDSWQVKKYKLGDWEALVEPTLKLVKWLEVRGGVSNDAKSEFKQAIEGFRKSGHLILPGGITSFTVESELGWMVRSGSSDDIVMELRSYIRDNPSHAAAWLALCHFFNSKDSYGAALYAIHQALDVMPDEVEFHIDAAGLYFTAISNSVGGAALYSFIPDYSSKLTLSELDCQYEEALAAFETHVEVFSNSTGPRSVRHEQMARRILSLRDKMPVPTASQIQAQARGIVKSLDSGQDPYRPVNRNDTSEHQSEFCEFIANRVIQVINGSNNSRLDSKSVYPWTVVFMLLGGSLATRYPDKAKLMLITGKQSSPAGGRDTRMEQEIIALSEGYGGGRNHFA